MSIISITITESEVEFIPGIPKYVTLEASIPANIFYTLDSTIPTTASKIYGSSIELPRIFNKVTLKLFASNGIDESAVITSEWNPDKATVGKINQKVVGTPIVTNPERYSFAPFGTNLDTAPAIWSNETALDITDDSTKENVSNGFDSEGQPNNFSDKTLDKYPMIYPPGDGGPIEHQIGTHAAPVKIIPQQATYDARPTTVNKLFNPRSLVLYQDSDDPNVDPDIPMFNKTYFISQNMERSGNGIPLQTPANIGTQKGGSFVKYFYNHREQKLTFYYYDNNIRRWIISKENYSSGDMKPDNLGQIVFASNSPGSHFVYKWVPFVPHRN